VASAVDVDDETPEQAAAVDRLLDAMDRPRMTVALLVAEVGAYIAVGSIPFVRGNADWVDIVVRSRGQRILGRSGAMWADGLDQGELWRLVSAMFLHAGWLHMLVNGLALIALGRLTEAIYGPVRLLWLFLLCGAGGAVLSWVGGNTLSVGASGALFGLMGAAIVFGWRHREALPEGPSRFLRWKLLPWLLLNLALGMLPFIDNLGHLGGLITGLVAASVVGNRLVEGEDGTRLSRGAMLLGSLALLGVGAWGVSTQW
jgi:membrane associated rhomboid family serine protease